MPSEGVKAKGGIMGRNGWDGGRVEGGIAAKKKRDRSKRDKMGKRGES